MKTTFQLLLFCGFISFSQQQTLVNNGKSGNMPFMSLGIKKPITFSVAPFQYKNWTRNGGISVYNATTGLTNNYTLYNGEYKISNSKSISKNEFWKKIELKFNSKIKN